MDAANPVSDQADPALGELEATRAVYEALKALSSEAQGRVLTHVSGLLKISGVQTGHHKRQSNGVQEEDLHLAQRAAPRFSSFADLFAAADPTTHAQKALVVGYWFQVCQEAENFEGQSANRELKHLGHGLSNITEAMSALKDQKPALALQLGKSGRTRQARKTYKLTVAGITAVEEMIGG